MSTPGTAHVDGICEDAHEGPGQLQHHFRQLHTILMRWRNLWSLVGHTVRRRRHRMHKHSLTREGRQCWKMKARGARSWTSASFSVKGHVGNVSGLTVKDQVMSIRRIVYIYGFQIVGYLTTTAARQLSRIRYCHRSEDTPSPLMMPF
jgi:hypothetical protein